MSRRSLSPLRITSRIRELFLRSLKELIRRRRLPFNISIVNDGMRKVRHLCQRTLLMKSICCEPVIWDLKGYAPAEDLLLPLTRLGQY